MSAQDPAACADVAVPLPLAEPLVYRVPEAFRPLARPGVRARVRVGSRRLTGVIVELRQEAPPGIALKDLERILDEEPVLRSDLLELARFTARYYLAPLGLVIASILPTDLPPWGDQRVWLTSGGALAPPRSPVEARVIEVLLEGGRMPIAELQRRTGLADLAALLRELAAAGRVALGQPRRAAGARYREAVELASGEIEHLRRAAGRSAPARAVLDYLAALGRPATADEVTTEVGCGPAVLRRLARLGLLRRFTQVERLALDRHLLSTAAAPPPVLRDDQRQAVGAVEAALAAGRKAAFLLTGVTGSGKTEVYLQATAAALARGRSAILLVPEIALVPALARVARERFGERLAILHSALGASERHQEWERARLGEARVILGPRSAVFAPVADLGLLVVDEEQDPSYKQEITPRYNGRDVAILRAAKAGAVVLLASATPSLESRFNAGQGRLEPLVLTERAGQGSLPEGILVDLRSEPAAGRPGEARFSSRLVAEIEAAVAAGDQVILLRNRRGYSPILLCRACGEDLRCEPCGLPRTFHRRLARMICHYCGSTAPAPPRCPACSEAALEPVGAGTERVEERFRELFPAVPVDVLDRDALRRAGGAAAVLERFARGEVQVLVGTQMVSKGHHFPRVSLTAVLSADSYLGFPDFRAVERTYTLLTQLAGRAGRGDKPGRVVIQTYHPDHYAIRAALEHDDEAFAREEMRFRQVFHYPPYTRMVQLLVRDPSRARAESHIRALAGSIEAHPLAAAVRVSGPAPAPFERLRGHWRFQLLLRAASGKQLRRLVEAVVPGNPPHDLANDVDPYQLL
jgi:primosomal protein N' (replication factor Y)